MIPLYGIYALLFADHGLTAGEISSLFVLWSVTSFVFEVPSGAWADLVDRRALLVASAAVYVAAFSSWMLWPSYGGFATGFVLWGISSAMMSGTFEALLYDELAARSAESRYAQILGWARSASMAAVLVATMACWPLFSVGGYALVGWTSVGIAVAHGLLAWSLPSAPKIQSAADDWIRPNGRRTFVSRYFAMLHDGIREATTSKPVRHVVLISAGMLGLMAYDEYFPLVARENGASTEIVPVLLAVVVVGQVVGTALAGRAAAMRGPHMAVIVGLSAVAIIAGAMSGHPAGFLGIAVGYGLVSNAAIVCEARLQEMISGPARATVTSVAGLSSEVVAVAIFAAFGLGSAWMSAAALLAVLSLPMLGLALAVGRWLPSPQPVTGRSTATEVEAAD